jgi:hypothetical protein
MRRLLLIAALVPVVAQLGCWADFPEARLRREAAPPFLDSAGVRDSGPNTDAPGQPDAPISCTAGAFVRCDGQTLVRCNEQGTGLVQITCSPETCDTGLGRCTQCEPGSAPTCTEGGERVTCSADGLRQLDLCPYGCADGECCVDDDTDGLSECQGDCNESSNRVHPGQTEFFDEAVNGSFDFNCDETEEPEFGLVNCQGQGANCAGDGWVDAIPTCGTEGPFATCEKQGGDCEQQPPETLKAACR